MRKAIGAVQGVDAVHDLHVWSITSGMPALSAHVVVTDVGMDTHRLLDSIQSELRQQFNIDHTTLQIEPGMREDCGCC